MKKVDLTKDEMRTLIWALQSAYAKLSKEDLTKGRKPADDPILQKICSISKKVNGILVKCK